jgi:serine/threonine-protein kinase
MSMTQDDEALLAALVARLADGEAIDPATIPAALRDDPRIARLLSVGRALHALDDNLREPPAAAAPAAPPGERIGPWRLLRLLGSGGMGDVWLGERSDGTVEQRVAIKRVRGDLPQFAQRLESERRILARLSHPNIARFIDAGVAPGGAPWLALEYVEGAPITDWCETRQLGLATRLRLFCKVCAAVEHAHRHLVVHRDLKPGNVLVDAEGEPKLLDFGIAKLLEDGGQQSTVSALTPAYAAPEQLRGGEISTATDVYALGLLLFRLLAGELPSTRRNPSAATVLARLDEEETQRVSVHAARAAGLPFAADALEGDLDCIVAQALRQLPEARYGSPAALADDIERHLALQPVRARPATRRYRLSRFARRHRGALSVTIAAALALTVSAGVAVWQAQRAAVAAAQARSEAQRADAQAETARSEANRARRATTFVMSTFAQSNPLAQDARGAISLDEAFEDALRRLDDERDQEPLLAADLNGAFGAILTGKGRFEDAEARLRAALALSEARRAPDAAETAEILLRIGELESARGRPLEGRAALQRAAAILEPQAEAHPLLSADVRFALASLDAMEGRFDEALAQAAAALARYRASLPADDVRLANAIFNHGAALLARQDWDAAGAEFESALALVERVKGPRSAAALPILDGLVVVRDMQERYPEALALAQRTLDVARSVYPGAHPRHAEALIEVGDRLVLESRDPAGFALIERGTAMLAELRSADELRGWRRLALTQARFGRREEASRTVEQGVARCVALAEADANECVLLRAFRASFLLGAKRPVDALAAAQRAVDDGRARVPGSDALAEALKQRGRALAALERTDEALASLREAREVYLLGYPAEHPNPTSIGTLIEQLESTPRGP